MPRPSWLRSRRDKDGASTPPPKPDSAGTSGPRTEEPSSISTLAIADSVETTGLSIQSRIWNQAYDTLREKEPDLVNKYEELLSKLTAPGDESTTLATRTKTTILGEPARWKLMEDGIKVGLERTRKRAERFEKVGDFVDRVNAIKSLIDRAVKASPEAAVAWTVVCCSMEILANPISESDANRKGLEHITSTMSWYWHLASHMFTLDTLRASELDLRQELEGKMVKLFTKLLAYQMKSFNLYQEKGVVVFFKDVVKMNDWAQQLESIKKEESAIRNDIQQYKTERMDYHLQNIADDTKLLQTFLTIMRENQSHQADNEWQDLWSATVSVRPEVRMQKIIHDKGGLIPGCCEWFNQTDDFIQWCDNPSQRVLWIKGKPGKGKTMLMCSMIDEMQHKRVKLSGKEPFCFSYFFCTGTNASYDTQAAILRGLVFDLAEQLPHLRQYVKKHRHNINQSDDHAQYVLLNALGEMLQDSSMDGVVLFVDALDECADKLSLLLKVIIDKKLSPRTKWVLSSRSDWNELQEELRKAQSISSCLAVDLEHHHASVRTAVDRYVDQKVAELEVKKDLDAGVSRKIRSTLLDKAQGTFLWVSLVCAELMHCDEFEIEDALNEFPAGLFQLYNITLAKLAKTRSAAAYKEILGVISVAIRPVTLLELLCLTDPHRIGHSSIDKLTQMVQRCGSLLSLQNGIVTVIHQSVKDFLVGDHSILEVGHLISSPTEAHLGVLQRSLTAMRETLVKADIYDLVHPGALAKGARKPSPDPLARVAYSCVYWYRHLVGCNLDKSSELAMRMCLLEMLSDGSAILGGLKAMIAEITSPQLKELVLDASRFLLYFKTGIEIAPLQTYVSGLLFAPLNSLVGHKLRDEQTTLRWITASKSQSEDWGSCSLTLEYNTMVTGWPIERRGSFWHGEPRFTCISSNAASVWDLNTGAIVHTTPTGHGSNQYDLTAAVSSDGRYVAWLLGNTIYAWNAVIDSLSLESSEVLAAYLRELSDSTDTNPLSMTRLQFSDDNRHLLLSRRRPRTRSVLLMTNITESSQDTGFLRLDASAVIASATYLWQANLVVSITSTGHVQIWDVMLSSCISDFELDMSNKSKHTDMLLLRSCPMNMRRFFLIMEGASLFGEVQLWQVDPPETTCVWHISNVLDPMAIEISLDGRLVAVRRYPEDVLEVYDLNTQRCYELLRIETGRPILFWSQDNKKLGVCDGRASSSALRFYHHDLNFSLFGEPRPISSTLLTGGNVFVLSDDEGKLFHNDTFSATMWELDTTVEGDNSLQNAFIDPIHSTCLSPDGQWLCLIRRFAGPQLRRTTSTTKDFDLELEDYYASPKFSSDSKRLALNNRGDTSIWDLSTGTPSLLRNLTSNERTHSVSFDPDGQRYATIGDTLKIWDLSTGHFIRNMDTEHTPMERFSQGVFLNSLSQLVTSHDDSRTFSPTVLKVWDIQPDAIVLKFSFQPAHERIKIQAWERSGIEQLVVFIRGKIQLWDIHTWSCVRTIMTPFTFFWRSPERCTGGDAHASTVHGIIDLSELTAEEVQSKGRLHGYGIGLSRDWLIKDGRIIVWLPPDYRPHSEDDFQVCRNRVVIVNQMGRMCLLSFDDDKFSKSLSRADVQGLPVFDLTWGWS